jgi:hypothetical protein
MAARRKKTPVNIAFLMYHGSRVGDVGKLVDVFKGKGRKVLKLGSLAGVNFSKVEAPESPFVLSCFVHRTGVARLVEFVESCKGKWKFVLVVADPAENMGTVLDALPGAKSDFEFLQKKFGKTSVSFSHIEDVMVDPKAFVDSSLKKVGLRSVVLSDEVVERFEKILAHHRSIEVPEGEVEKRKEACMESRAFFQYPVD